MPIKLDDDATYTIEQAARLLMEVSHGMTFDEAFLEVCSAILSGELPVVGKHLH